MPLVIEQFDNLRDSTNLAEFVANYRECGVDFNDQNSIVETSHHLKKLNNNKSFLLDKITEEICSDNEFQQGNNYGSHVFMLHSCEDYFLRANVWRPITEIEKSLEKFEYDVCHDHNFDILTCGYFGPGYTSRCYEYESAAVDGLLGEKVELLKPDTFYLIENSMALYRAHQDVHMQLPPASLSISLNMIPRTDKFQQAQYQFNETSSTIERYLNCSAMETIVRLAGSVGDEKYIDPLLSLSRKSTANHLKAYAMVSCYRLDSTMEPLLRRELANAAPVVEQIFDDEVNALNSTI